MLSAYFILTMDKIVKLNSIKPYKKCVVYSVNNDLSIFGIRKNELIEVVLKTANYLVILFDSSILYLNKSDTKEIYVKVL